MTVKQGAFYDIYPYILSHALPIVAFCDISVSLLASGMSGDVVTVVEDTGAEGLWNVELFRRTVGG